jgi:hypothetical protein
MELKEACQIVQDYADRQGLPFLEALISMEADWDDLDRQDRAAFIMFMKAGERMFSAG